MISPVTPGGSASSFASRSSSGGVGFAAIERSLCVVRRSCNHQGAHRGRARGRIDVPFTAGRAGDSPRWPHAKMGVVDPDAEIPSTAPSWCIVTVVRHGDPEQ
jgi:hypothetical protein